MSKRVASSTIQGFLYQFLVTLETVLEQTEDENLITVEGIFEDIDVVNTSGVVTNAIQCKYHASVETFTLSKVSKALSLMISTDVESAEKVEKFVLYAYFPDQVEVGERAMSSEEFDSVLSSENSDIKKILDPIREKIDKERFVGKFLFRFGQSIEEKESQVIAQIVNLGESKEDVECLLFPNAVQYIASKSGLAEKESRTVSKNELISHILGKKNVVLSKWTKELITFDQQIKKARKEFYSYLKINTRYRGIVISEPEFEKLKEELIDFVCSFLDIYCYKAAHTKTPLLVLDIPVEELKDVKRRLANKEMWFNDGYVGEHFIESRFNREPIRKIEGKLVTEWEFRLKLLSTENITVINQYKPDDLYIIGDYQDDALDVEDINKNSITVKNMSQLKYLMGVQDEYDS